MKRLKTIAWCVPIACAMFGCNAILGIENAKLNADRNDAGPTPVVVCEDGSCATPCERDEDCPSDASCIDKVCVAGDAGVDPDASDAACHDGEMRCEGIALPTRLECAGGIWKSAAPCQDGQLCDSQAKVAGECKAVVEKCLGRTPSEPFCIGSERVVCGPDLVSAASQSCGTSMLCNLGQGAACATCMPKEARCDGDKLLKCNAHNDGFDEAETCKPGECRANLARCTSMVCDPDAYSCEGKMLQRCNSAGSGYVDAERKDCGAGSCDALHGQCDICEEKSTLGCADMGSQALCSDDGQTKITRPCTELSLTTPTCVGAGVCVQCAPNSRSCTDPRTLVTCSGQGAPATTTCTNTTCVAGRGCVGECAPMQAKCLGKASAGRTVCGPEGMYIASDACPMNTLCDSSDGQCKPIVDGCMGRQPGDAVCVGSTRIVCGPDLVTTMRSEDCTSADLCAASTGPSCAKCTATTFECRTTQLWGCNAAGTGLELKNTCATAALCNANLGRCTTQICEPNQYSCTGTGNNTLQRCNATGSMLLAGTPCGNDICDAMGGQCDKCRGGTYTGCSGTNNRLLCAQDGQNTTPEACPTGTPICTGTGRCVQCTSSSCSTDLKTANSCLDGTQTSTMCAADKTCVNAACIGPCGPGQTQCAGTESPARNACGPAGSFIAGTACPSGQNCERSTNSCKAIITGCEGHRAGDWTCSGLNRIQCGTDLTSIAASGQQCTTVALCQNGTGSACAPCTDGVTPDRCNQAQPEHCSGNTWVAKGSACASASWCSGNGVCSDPFCQPGQYRCRSDLRTRERCNMLGTGWDPITPVCAFCNSNDAANCLACQPGVTLGNVCFSANQQSVCNTAGTATDAPKTCAAPRTTCTTGNTCVQCTASSCANAGTLNQCTGGTLSTVTCGAQQTCIADSNPRCGGSCRAGTFQCNTTTKNPETCLSGGTWQQTATCNLPSQICSASASGSSCVPNDPYSIGDFTTDDSWGNLFTLEDTIYFRPITAPRLATLQFFRLVGNPPVGDTAGSCRMVIYTDSGGAPGTLLTWTPTSIPVIAGTGGAAPGSSGIQLNGTYWVGAECFHPSGSATLRSKSVAGAQYIRASHTVGTAFPTTWPANSGTRVTGTALAFSLQVQNVP